MKFSRLRNLLLVGGFIALSHYPAFNTPVTVSAEACATEEECRQIMADANAEVSTRREEDRALESEMADVMSQIEETQREIRELEDEIEGIQEEIEAREADILEIENYIEEKEVEIVAAEAELEATNERITELSDLIGQRMESVQRNRFTNVWLDLLSNSADLLSLVRNFTLMSNLLEHDARIMQELNDLLELQESLLEQLEIQREELTEARRNLVNQRLALVAQRQILEQRMETASELREELAAQQQYLGSRREAL